MKEATYYEPFGEAGKGWVRCTLCPRDCVILPGNLGFCGVRLNKEGKLYLTVYGHPESVAVDPIEKKPLYHFYPGSMCLSIGTLGCNFRCKHCQNYDISHEKTKGYEEEGIPHSRILQILRQTNSHGISFTYNEPTILLEYIRDVYEVVKPAGFYTVLVTNGFISEKPLRDFLPLLDAYRVDIKSMKEQFFRHISYWNDPKPVLRSAVVAKEMGAHVELVYCVITNYNDSEEEMREIASWAVSDLGKDTVLHITRYFPQPGFDEPPTPLETLRRAYEIAREEGLGYVYVGNVPQIPNDTRCPNCGNLIVERTGYYVRIKDSLDTCSKCATRLNFIHAGRPVSHVSA